MCLFIIMNSNSITCYYKQITFILPTQISTYDKLVPFINDHFGPKANVIYFKRSNETFYTRIISQEDLEELQISDHRYMFIGKESVFMPVVENGLSMAYTAPKTAPSFITKSRYQAGDCIKLQTCCKCSEIIQNTYTILSCKHQCHTKCAVNRYLKCKECN